jgi:hypothetical protein
MRDISVFFDRCSLGFYYYHIEDHPKFYIKFLNKNAMRFLPRMADYLIVIYTRLLFISIHGFDSTIRLVF